ncbi:MAG: M3 family oligoendopeptidase [Candidatus Sericytochromatia bacterium]|nr:M3 family oligoendopeptidase [Candidatus Sericytochromatia bacterium]
MSTLSSPPEQLRWDLGHLYASKDDPALQADLAAMRREAEALRQEYLGRVALLTPGELLRLLQRYEAWSGRISQLGAFASLTFSENSQDEAGKALYAKVRTALTEAHADLQFIEIELQATPEAHFAAHLRAGDLHLYHYYLERVRRHAPHTLSDAEERLCAIKNTTGVQAWTQLYVEITANMKVEVGTPEASRLVTIAEARALRSGPDRDMRQRASAGLFRAHQDQAHVLTYIFNTVFEDHRQSIAMRHFQDPMAPTLLEEDLAPEVVEALMATTEAHYGLAQRYYRTKAKVLGIPDFATHDVLAPYSAQEEHVPFAEGQAIVLDALQRFSPRHANLARAFFEGRYIDVPPAPGKQGGAFCSGMSPGLHPYVLLNYTHTLQDVLTLAHELGHGIHFLLAGQAQTLLNYYPITPLAETASTFAELVTLNRLLEEARDPAVRLQLLATRVEDAISTVMRQVMFTRWEQRAHALRRDGVVSTEQYSALWGELNRALYGDVVQTQAHDQWGWITIPHLVKYRFYCYSYAFGQLLVYALYQMYQEQGEAFVPKLDTLLAAGGSAPATVLLDRIGIDIRDPAFWEKGFALVTRMLEEYEEAARSV